MHKARVIITLECLRNCSYCCNNYSSIMSTMKPLRNVAELRGYGEILITGGEPMLDWRATLEIIKLFRKANKNAKLYLYSADYQDSWLFSVIDHVDGLHFTLHANSSLTDIRQFYILQSDISLYMARYPKRAQNKSFRLYISPKIQWEVTIKPALWARVEVKPWLSEENCSLPTGEELFMWEGPYGNSVGSGPIATKNV